MKKIPYYIFHYVLQKQRKISMSTDFFFQRSLELLVILDCAPATYLKSGTRYKTTIEITTKAQI